MRLKELREQHGLSTKQMAKILGVKEKTYLNYEKDEGKLHLMRAIQIVRFFDVSMEYFIGRKNKP